MAHKLITLESSKLLTTLEIVMMLVSLVICFIASFILVFMSKENVVSRGITRNCYLLISVKTPYDPSVSSISYSTKFSALVGSKYSNYYLNGLLGLPMFCGNTCKQKFGPYKMCDSRLIPSNCQTCFLLSSLSYHQTHYYSKTGSSDIQGNYTCATVILTSCHKEISYDQIHIKTLGSYKYGWVAVRDPLSNDMIFVFECFGGSSCSCK